MDGSTYSPGSGGTAGHVVEPAGEMGHVMALMDRLPQSRGVGAAGGFLPADPRAHFPGLMGQ
ncbi:hypothetical protein ABIB49_003447 [Arthrobacter sp. UYCu512]